jgi:hypothetical protein
VFSLAFVIAALVALDALGGDRGQPIENERARDDGSRRLRPSADRDVFSRGRRRMVAATHGRTTMAGRSLPTK